LEEWELQKPGGNHAKTHDSRLALKELYFPVEDIYLTVEVV